MPGCTITFECGHCGLTVVKKNVRRSHPPKYCSKRCSDLGQRRRVTATCDSCKKQFEDSAGRSRRFCSRECSSKSKKRYWIDPSIIENPRYCECKCGGVLPNTKGRWGKLGPVRFLTGHHTRVMGRVSRNYVPPPDQIPSGICECGCGGQTPIAKHTNARLRQFRGYPMRFMSSHGYQRKGVEHNGWKGGFTMTADGYRKVLTPEGHRNKHRYILEHRLVMETVLGRFLERWEQVHHINGDKVDNRPKNLELWKRSQPSGVRSADYHCAGCRCAGLN